MWARMECNTVKELIGFNPIGKYHPNLIFEECPEDTKEGDVLEDGTFKTPTTSISPITAPAIIENLMAEIILLQAEVETLKETKQDKLILTK